jgi:MATE family multidrug resistance protein
LKNKKREEINKDFLEKWKTRTMGALKTAKLGGKKANANEWSSSTFAVSSPMQARGSRSASPLIDGITVLETMELHHVPPALIETNAGDYPPVENFEDVKFVCSSETKKVWAIAGPIAFNILCNYGINSITGIFVGHLGNVELSAVSISLNVIAYFSLGFLVISFFNFSTCISTYIVL